MNEFVANTVERVAYEVDDAGAFYTGRSWLQRGNVLRSNVFRGIRTRTCRPPFSILPPRASCGAGTSGRKGFCLSFSA